MLAELVQGQLVQGKTVLQTVELLLIVETLRAQQVAAPIREPALGRVLVYNSFVN